MVSVLWTSNSGAVMSSRVLECVQRVAKVLGERGYEIRLELEPPATEERVLACEQALGRALPPSLRRWFLEHSAELSFYWFVPEGTGLPAPFEGIYSGQCGLGLEALLENERHRQGWVETVFPNPNDTYDRVWHGKLGLLRVENGDIVAIDMEAAEDGPVLFLSHEFDLDAHGKRLGESFGSFLQAWSRLLFISLEEWVWGTFHDATLDRIDADSDKARAFRALMGVPEGD